MFNSMNFKEARDLSVDAVQVVEMLYAVFGEACAETLCDAAHCYLKHEDWHDTSGYDVDFLRIFALAYVERNGYEVKPEFSGLTGWSGRKGV